MCAKAECPAALFSSRVVRCCVVPLYRIGWYIWLTMAYGCMYGSRWTLPLRGHAIGVDVIRIAFVVEDHPPAWRQGSFFSLFFIFLILILILLHRLVAHR
mmetsp:Transcript_35289/g.70359  ORF Transcript_35289/g.70359 Transcript_35289/m.70359 type:complete len:100 (-) Transcript_35289:2278-2577(-)